MLARVDGRALALLFRVWSVAVAAGEDETSATQIFIKLVDF